MGVIYDASQKNPIVVERAKHGMLHVVFPGKDGTRVVINPKFMRLAIEKNISAIKEGAKKGKQYMPGPFGAVITTFDGKVVANTYNTVILGKKATKHAEMNAIDLASTLQEIDQVREPYLLSNHVIYSTCEPCPMCLKAIDWAKIPIVVYGTTIKDAKTLGMNETEQRAEATIVEYGMNIVLIKNFLSKEAKKIFDLYKKLGGTPY